MLKPDANIFKPFLSTRIQDGMAYLYYTPAFCFKQYKFRRLREKLLKIYLDG